MSPTCLGSPGSRSGSGSSSNRIHDFILSTWNKLNGTGSWDRIQIFCQKWIRLGLQGTSAGLWTFIMSLRWAVLFAIFHAVMVKTYGRINYFWRCLQNRSTLQYYLKLSHLHSNRFQANRIWGLQTNFTVFLLSSNGLCLWAFWENNEDRKEIQ